MAALDFLVRCGQISSHVRHISSFCDWKSIYDLGVSIGVLYGGRSAGLTKGRNSSFFLIYLVYLFSLIPLITLNRVHRQKDPISARSIHMTHQLSTPAHP